jgi:hypothetical protein
MSIVDDLRARRAAAGIRERPDGTPRVVQQLAYDFDLHAFVGLLFDDTVMWVDAAVVGVGVFVRTPDMGSYFRAQAHMHTAYLRRHAGLEFDDEGVA